MFAFLDRPLCRAAGVTAALAVTAALVMTMAKAAPTSPAAGDTARTASTERAPLIQQAAATGSGPFPLFARDKNGRLFDYEPKGTGGFAARFDLGGGYADATALAQVDSSLNRTGTDLYVVLDDTLYYTAERGIDTKVLGSGWGAYNLLVSAGNMGGTADPDLLARDKNGDLWLYQGKADGTFLARLRVGTGWNGMDELTGRGDYTGDGKADLVARSTSGTLYVYPGTGNAIADAVLEQRVPVPAPPNLPAWKNYSTLVSVGDNDGDGRPDLIGVDSAGALWLIGGSGIKGAAFGWRTQIGTSGWTAYNLLF